MQRGHRVDVQSLEEAGPKEPCRGVQALGGLHWIAGEQAEEHLGVGVIRRDLDGLERDHADPRVFQLARDQIRQIALDLVGHLEGAIGLG
ncbi:MAG: hypothetical protein BWX79_01312 [Alphaproteobacteria bacterium ADurb.Bin100]|nr:MAG: hypothetical protein BWX79_01312 [Alphaproteobacteria bacterium ADurb.Bin100]